jgi:hypothetical protein
MERPVRLGEQLRLVIVDREVRRLLDHLPQLRAVEERQPLSGVEQRGDAGLRQLREMVLHALLAVGRDDPQREVRRLRNAASVRLVHRARVERGDLVVVEIGDDERLRR